MRFVPFPGLRSSGGQVLGECTVPGGPFVLITSPVLCKFCNQIPLAFKVKFPYGSQSSHQIPRLGNLLWALELS